MKNCKVIFLLSLFSAFGGPNIYAQNVDSIFRVIDKLGENTQHADLLDSMSYVYYFLGDYFPARRFADSSLACSKRIKYSIGEADAHNMLGLIYNDQGNYAQALIEHFASLAMNEKSGTERDIARTYGNIGIVYDNMHNSKEALRYLKMGMKISMKIGNKRLQANAFNNIGIVYDALDSLEIANEYYHKCMMLMYALNDRQGVATSYLNMGLISARNQNFTEAKSNLDSALFIFQSIDDKEGIAMTCGNLATVNYHQGHYDEAKRNLAIEFEIANEIGSYVDLQSYYGVLSKLDSILGDYKNSFEHYKLFIAFTDSLNNEENTRSTVQTQMNYEFDKKQVRDSISNLENLKHEQLKHDEEIQQQRIYTYGGGIGFILMLIVAGVSFRAYRSKQKANEIISHQKLLVEEKQKEILDSIHYAKRIQQSLLPTEKYIDGSLRKLKRGI
ncbi:hypothetical protein BH09BAC5_BH09BAC5_15330 [soil metagenome]